VRDLVTDADDRTIVRTIITMAHSLNINVIAEGVETEEQRQYLLDKGCMHSTKAICSANRCLLMNLRLCLRKADCSSFTKVTEALFRYSLTVRYGSGGDL